MIDGDSRASRAIEDRFNMRRRALDHPHAESSARGSPGWRRRGWAGGRAGGLAEADRDDLYRMKVSGTRAVFRRIAQPYSGRVTLTYFLKVAQVPRVIDRPISRILGKPRRVTNTGATRKLNED